MTLPNSVFKGDLKLISKVTKGFTIIPMLTALVLYSDTWGLAAEWTIVPNITITETYQDNVTLAPENNEESDYITEINPGISIRANGARASFDLDYQIQNLFYLRNNNANTINHELATNINAEVLTDLLFLDFSGSYNQAIISPEARVGFDNLSITENFTDVGTYSISPYLIKRFANLALAELRYSYEKVNYSGGNTSLSDADNQQIFINLASYPFTPLLAGNSIDRLNRSNGNRSPVRTPSTPLQWSLTYEREKIINENEPDIKFEQVALDLNYRVGANIIALGGIGYENNEFERASDTTEPQGLSWRVGMVWNPTRRTSLEATIEERSFGDTYSFILQHYTRQTTAEVVYIEELTTSSGSVLENQSFPGVDEFGNPILDPTDEPQPIGVPLPALNTTEVFLRKRFTADITKATARSLFSIGAFSEKREFQSSGEEERVYGGTASWEWQPTARTRSLLFSEWQRQRFSEENRQDDLGQIGLRITRQIRPNVDGYLEYRYGRRQSTEVENEYELNTLAASLRVQF